MQRRATAEDGLIGRRLFVGRWTVGGRRSPPVNDACPAVLLQESDEKGHWLTIDWLRNGYSDTVKRFAEVLIGLSAVSIIVIVAFSIAAGRVKHEPQLVMSVAGLVCFSAWRASLSRRT